MTAIELIDSIIIELNEVSVCGVENMVRIMNSLKKLGALRKDLKGENEHEDHNKPGESL